MEIYIVFYKGKPYETDEGIIIFTKYEKIKNYRNNAVRHVGRLICDGDWYDMGEKNKQKWFNKADKLLEIKSFKEFCNDIECQDCYNYNIGDGIDDIRKCYGCKNFKN